MSCQIFNEYEDRLVQQLNIMGLLFRGMEKLLGNSKHTDKYIHKKCHEFAEMGLESTHKVDKFIREIRNAEEKCDTNGDTIGVM